MYPKSNLPPEIIKIILQYVRDRDTLLTFGGIRGYEFDALDLLVRPAYVGLSDQVKTLLPYPAAIELISDKDIPKFMRKYYSTENGRAALPPEVLGALGQACHQLLSRVANPEAIPATVPVFTREALIEEDAKIYSEMDKITCCNGNGNLVFFMIPLYFMMLSDLLAVFAEELPYDFDRRALRIAAGILIPFLIFLLSIPLTADEVLSELRKKARSFDAPDAPTESYREWLLELCDDLKSGEGRFLDLPKMNARATDTFYQKMKLMQTSALVLPALHSFIFQPIAYLSMILSMSQFDNWLYASTPSEFRAIQSRGTIQQPMGRHKTLISAGLLALWGATIGLIYQNEDFDEWMDEHTYSTQEYTKITVAIAAGNAVYLSLCLMLHVAPKIGEKIESTSRGIMHSWRRRNTPVAGNDVDLERAMTENTRLLN